MTRPTFIATAALLLTALSAPASADTLAGRVVDSMGNGVPSVNIDLEDMITGEKADVANDGTDANGDFLVTVDPGLYRVIFFPPPPPTTTHVVGVVENVSVVGASSMGTTALEAGVSLSGRLVDGGGVPLPGINLDFLRAGESEELPIPGDSSNGAGQFLVAVPLGEVDMEIRPSDSPPPPIYAPRRLELNLASNTALGDLTLEVGFALTAVAQRPNGTPVSGADADIVDATTGDALFTPGDGSDGSGGIEVIVPAGTYDIEVCPPSGSVLAGGEVTGVVVAGTTDAGVITLVPGVVLSGQVTDATGVPVQGADVDVRDAVTGVGIVTCDDNTDASGIYSIRIPNGTYDVIFSVPSDPDMGSATVANVVVSGPTSVDGKLPGCDCIRYCDANPNSTGQAACLTASGVVGSSLVLRSTPVPNTTGQIFFGPMMLQGNTFGDGLLCVGGMTTRVLPFISAGMMMQLPNTATLQLNYSAPYASALSGTVHFQHWFRSGLATGSGFNTSDALTVTF